MNTDRLISTDAAIQIVADLLREQSVRGMRALDVPTYGSSLHIEFKRAWSVSCDLSLSFSSGERTAVHARRSSSVEDHVWVQRPNVQVCWSSSGRDVATATACLALYREVIELAALIEARLAEETIGWSEKAASAEASR
ncbi:MAG: hypothetical protein ACXWVM_31995 [Polyangiales bacterium]